MNQMMLYDARKKSAGVAYALWFFLGMLGAHRFYLGRWVSGLVILLLTVGSLLLTGGLGLVLPGLWVLVDLFLVGGMVRDWNEKLAREL